jgi:uncharacterized membrane protein YtjA (UPF0391 family)
MPQVLGSKPLGGIRDSVAWLRLLKVPNPNMEVIMLSWSLTFLVIALVAAVLGFAGVAGTAAGIAKILFTVFLVLFVISLLAGNHPFRKV